MMAFLFPPEQISEGWRRILILAALAWAAWFLWIAWETYENLPYSGLSFYEDRDWAKACILIAATGPFVASIVGRVTAWVVRGFRQ